MKRVAIKFLRSFLVMFVLVGLYHLSLHWIFDFEMNWVLMLVPVIIFAILLTAIHFMILKKKGINFNEKPYLVTAWDKIGKIEQFAYQNGWELVENEADKIKFRTRMDSWLSFGEIVRVKRKKGDKAYISSKSFFSTTIFDFGKNLDNIKAIRDALEYRQQ